MPSVLELDVSAGDEPGSYRVQVIQSPAGEASAAFELEPFQLIEHLPHFQQTLLASSVPSRKVLSRGETAVRGIGQRLFEALFSQQSLAGLYRACCAVAVERGEQLRMVLRINAPELAALPWESMFDEAAGSYVCRREPLVRYVPVAASPPPLTVALPLRVLGLIASPRGLAALDVEKEKEGFNRALAGPIAQGRVVVHWLERATWANLQDALLTESWHVVHFVGHGDFDIERDEGVLALEAEDGRVHRVTAESFVDLLREAQPMPRLVVLNACESATSGGTDMFSGTAATLVRGGVSAVTAMQFEISDAAAIAFCRGFYAAIGRGRGVDEAVRSGRVSILGLGDGCLEWITPTLYLRGRETHLFDVTQAPEPEIVIDPVTPLAPPTTPEPLWATEPAPAPAPVETVAPPMIPQQYPAYPQPYPPQQYPPQQYPVQPPTAPATVAPAYMVGSAPVYPDRFEDLWSVAKRIGWTDRPLKSETRVLAQSVSPDEMVVGVTRMPFAFTQSCALVVTSRFLFLGTDTPKGSGWLAMLQVMPGEYQIGREQVRVPLTEIEWVDGGNGTLTLMLRGRRVAIPVYGGGDGLRDIVLKYLGLARGPGVGG